jgi:hypothetical protein
MTKEVNAITKLYDFILWMIPKIDKFPRNQKFLIGDRLETLVLDTLETLIEAAYTKNKGHLLRQANLQLEKMRYLVRLSKDLKLITNKDYEYCARAINDVGISVGAWLKYTNRETT